MSESVSFYSTLTPMYYTSKILGLVPFGISNDRFYKSKINTLWSIIFMISVLIWMFVGIQETVTVELGLIGKVTDLLDTYLNFVTVLFGISIQCFYVNDIFSILEDISKFDKHTQIFLEVNLNTEYKKTKRNVLIVVSFIVVFVITSIIFTTITFYVLLISSEYIGLYISITIPGLINTFLDLQFCVMILCLKNRFSWINKKICMITTNLEYYIIQQTVNTRSDVKNDKRRPVSYTVSFGLLQDQAVQYLERIKQNHYQLCNLCKKLNKIYSLQLLAIVGQNFISIIASLFIAGKHIYKDKILDADYIIHIAIKVILSVAQLVALISCCSSTSVEANKAGLLLHKILTLNQYNAEHEWKQELQLEVASFSLQLLHHNVEFTACKVFDVNETLLVSIVGAITTYLVIVIQFELGNNSNSKQASL